MKRSRTPATLAPKVRRIPATRSTTQAVKKTKLACSVLAEVASTLSAELGEGSIWDARSQRLLWLDLLRSRLYRFDPATGGNEEYNLSMYSKMVSSVVPLDAKSDPSGDVVGLTVREGFAVYNLVTSELRVLPGNPTIEPNERFNDGKIDPAGRYWAGTIVRDPAGGPSGSLVPEASLYRRDHDGSVTRVLAPVTISSGIVWTKDASTMYYIDTISARVDALDYDKSTGSVSNRRTCIGGFDLNNSGLPDGCTLDNEDMLWVAHFNGGVAVRYDPRTGKKLAEVRVPAAAGRQVTSVAFGGDGLGDLYLTTAREGITREDARKAGQPLAGCLFRAPRAALATLGAGPGRPAKGWRLRT